MEIVCHIKLIVLTCLILLTISSDAYIKHQLVLKQTKSDYLDEEISNSIGGKLRLSKDEQLVNQKLMELKWAELDSANTDFSRSYFDYRDGMRWSRVYNFIKAMPKGAALHVHSTGAMSSDYYLKITYKDHLYVCISDKDIEFKFSYTEPISKCFTKWTLMQDMRNSSKNVTQFDLNLRKHFTLVGSDHSSENKPWKHFQKIFSTVYPLWTFRPVWEEYFYDMLKQFRQDNVIYLEWRSSLPNLYELDGTTYSSSHFMTITKQIEEKFKRDYPDFLGTMLICSFYRKATKWVIWKDLQQTNYLKARYPEFVAGFDLVGQEDDGNPLSSYEREFKKFKNLDFFFHAGETKDYGTTTDENLIDAILLGTKRIGHGYALFKHPSLMKEVKDKNIGVEVNVISNNVLNLVSDARNHPLAHFIAIDLPVVLSSDDSGFWEADPLTTDFYVAFMGVASRGHDLRLLKQLALNSLKFSALSHAKKQEAYQLFYKKWDEFIQNVLVNF